MKEKINVDLGKKARSEEEKVEEVDKKTKSTPETKQRRPQPKPRKFAVDLNDDPSLTTIREIDGENITEDNVWEVIEILDAKFTGPTGNKTDYKVKWADGSITWEPALL